MQGIHVATKFSPTGHLIYVLAFEGDEPYTAVLNEAGAVAIAKTILHLQEVNAQDEKYTPPDYKAIITNGNTGNLLQFDVPPTPSPPDSLWKRLRKIFGI